MRGVERTELPLGGLELRSPRLKRPLIFTASQRKALEVHRSTVADAMVRLSRGSIELNSQLLDFHQYWRDSHGLLNVVVVPWEEHNRHSNYCINYFDHVHSIPKVEPHPDRLQYIFANLEGGDLIISGLFHPSQINKAHRRAGTRYGPHYFINISEAQPITLEALV